jgi:hypothetical protein
MADADRPAFTIREIRPEEFEALGALTVRSYAAIPGETDVGYHDELRDVANRAALVPVLVAVALDGRVLGGVSYVGSEACPNPSGRGRRGFGPLRWIPRRRVEVWAARSPRRASPVPAPTADSAASTRL